MEIKEFLVKYGDKKIEDGEIFFYYKLTLKTDHSQIYYTKTKKLTKYYWCTISRNATYKKVFTVEYTFNDFLYEKVSEIDYFSYKYNFNIDPNLFARTKNNNLTKNKKPDTIDIDEIISKLPKELVDKANSKFIYIEDFNRHIYKVYRSLTNTAVTKIEKRYMNTINLRTFNMAKFDKQIESLTLY